MENITALYEYHYDGEMGGIVIDKYKGEQEVVTIPESIDGLPVTAIGPQAFDKNIYLITVTLPDSITSIGHCAFNGCTYLNEINIPRGVTSIGRYTFERCLNLSKITIPDNELFL